MSCYVAELICTSKVFNVPKLEHYISYSKISQTFMTYCFIFFRGEVIGKAEANETIIYADIDLDRMEEIRQSVPLRNQRRSDLYQVEEK